jgi:hypothetical protein
MIRQQPSPTRWRVIAAAAVAAIATATSSGCSSGLHTSPAPSVVPPSPGSIASSGSPRGLSVDVGSVKTTDVDAVAAAFGVLLGSYDCRSDRSIRDAAVRAAVLATPQLAKQLRSEAGPKGPVVHWSLMASHDGYTTVRARLGGLGPNPPDQLRTAARALSITVEPHGAAWHAAALAPQPLLVTLHREARGGPWAVARIKSLN